MNLFPITLSYFQFRPPEDTFETRKAHGLEHGQAHRPVVYAEAALPDSGRLHS